MYHPLAWQLAGTTATTQFSFSRGTLDLCQPDRGVRVTHPALEGAGFFQIQDCPSLDHVPPAEIDAYVREADLIVNYASTPMRPNRLQLNWRLQRELPAGLQAACELIISVNTPQWHSDPRITLETVLPATLGCYQTDGMTICEQAAGTYVQLAHPLDFFQAHSYWTRDKELTPAEVLATSAGGLAGTVVMRQPLFVNNLEKGVILRARLWAGWFAAGVDRQLILAQRDHFANSALVLTA
ncbi:MAG: hypothetical protein SFX18_09415 [Pirellulales bacterium]|nr:hypothetical protein [Pirellulales bacterium]